MSKPTVYIDTSFISACWYGGAEISKLASRSWWDNERRHFELWTSDTTEDELAAGDYRNQERMLNTVRRIRYLPLSAAVQATAKELIECNIVPETKLGDALQIAYASVHAIDYLLTWNYAHLANHVAQQRLTEFCGKRELRVPWMVTPESIPHASFGQTIRRRS